MMTQAHPTIHRDTSNAACDRVTQRIRFALLLASTLLAVPIPFASAQSTSPKVVSSSKAPVSVPQGKLIAMNATGDFGPVDAPVTMVLFSDFECPYSAEMFFTLKKLQKELGSQMHVIVKQSPILETHPNAVLAHKAALAAGKQGKYQQMAELLFANQERQERGTVMNYARLLKMDVVLFQHDLDSAAVAAALRKDMQESKGFAINQTPSMFINGRLYSGTLSEKTLGDIIKQASKTSVATTLAQQTVIPEGENVEPALLVRMMTQPSAARGTSASPVTIVEFTDFQCPFCRAAVAPMEELMAKRGANVRWIFRSFPLSFHPDSELANEAALAAGAQGKFWEMHDLLFGNQQALKMADLRRYAQGLNLNMTAFDDALAKHRYAAQIAQDRVLGTEAGVDGTPTFFVNGQRMTGARSLVELNQIVDAVMQSPGSTVPGAVIAQAIPKAEHEAVVSGRANAPLELVWFTDVRSPLAERQKDLMLALVKRYEGQVRLVYKAFPVAAHEDGRLGSKALLAAHEQGMFWEMFSALTQRRDVLKEKDILGLAKGAGLDMPAFTRAMNAEKTDIGVTADMDEATARGIQGAPVVFVNDQRIDGLQREDFYTAVIAKILKVTPAAVAKMEQK